MFANSALSLIDFLFSGVLVRFPDLKLLYAEAQIGWIPYVLERVDDVWDVHRGWSDSQRNVSEPPSQYYYRQVVSCFFKDGVGVENLDRVGRDNIAFETDYPHQDSTWPNTHQVAKELFGQLDADDGAQDRARQRHPVPRARGPRRRHARPRPVVTTLDPAATTVVDRGRRSARTSNGCSARSACPPTRRRSSPTTWSRPTCAASTPTAPT